MISASEAKAEATGFSDLRDTCEEKIEEQAESGGMSAVIMGYTDIASEAVAKELVDELRENGYEAYVEGVNLFIQW